MHREVAARNGAQSSLRWPGPVALGMPPSREALSFHCALPLVLRHTLPEWTCWGETPISAGPALVRPSRATAPCPDSAGTQSESGTLADTAVAKMQPHRQRLSAGAPRPGGPVPSAGSVPRACTTAVEPRLPFRGLLRTHAVCTAATLAGKPPMPPSMLDKFGTTTGRTRWPDCTLRHGTYDSA